ncbi:MAG: hypothetical protein WKF88_05595 [Ferruginibacter sp.]
MNTEILLSKCTAELKRKKRNEPLFFDNPIEVLNLSGIKDFKIYACVLGKGGKLIVMTSDTEWHTVLAGQKNVNHLLNLLYRKIISSLTCKPSNELQSA